MHVHFPVAAVERQSWPFGQTPPQRGAGLCGHGGSMSRHPQKFVPGMALHISLVGHLPPHWGNTLLAHGGTMSTQPQMLFSGLGRQA